MDLQKNLCRTKTIQQIIFTKHLSISFKRICLFLLIFIFQKGYAQDLIRDTQNGVSTASPNDTSLLYQNIEPDLKDQFENIAPTSYTETNNIQIDEFLKFGVLLQMEPGYIKKLINTQPKQLQMGVPVSYNNYFELQLIKIDITSNDFTTETHSGSVETTNENEELFYWGIVKDNPGSMAAVSFYEDEVRCSIADKDGNYTIGAYGDAHILFADKDIDMPFHFNCTTTEEFFGEESVDGINTITEQDLEEFINIEPIEINVECDYSIYRALDFDKVKVENYVMALFNESAVLYANENIKIKLSKIYIWDIQDTYAELPGTASMLDVFSEVREGTNAGEANILLTARNLEDGSTGHAYLGGLCSNNRNFGVVRLLNTNYDEPVSSYSRDIYTFTHELGHIFGSWHTHDCVWGQNRDTALDNCETTFNPYGQQACFDGPTPVNGGSIMSYCVDNSQFINFDKGFGEEPGNLIRAYLSRGNCVDPQLCTLDYNPQVLIDHPYLSQYINDENCAYTEVYVYDYYVYLKNNVNNYLFYAGDENCADRSDLDCFEFFSDFLGILNYSSCGCSINNPPPPSCEITCNTDPCLGGGIEALNQATCTCEIVEPTKTGCDDPTAQNYDPTVNCPDNTTCIQGATPTCIENYALFTNYSWLNNVVNLNNCNGVSIKEYKKVYSTATYFYVEVISGNSSVLYYETGYELCLDCTELYQLTDDDVVDSCECSGCEISGCTDVNACNYYEDACKSDGSCTFLNSYKGTVFYDFCDDGTSFFFIRLEDGSVVDPYNANGVDFNYPDNVKVQFGYVDADFDSPCSIAEKAVYVTCIEAIILPEPICDYATTGTVFYDFCDDGTSFFFIRLEDGSIVDPYNAEDVEFDYPNGVEVEFSYVDAGFDTPCSIAEKAIEVICIREAEDQPICDQNDGIFNTYPFLEGIINTNNCNGESIYIEAPYIIVVQNDERSLYLETGQYYCNWDDCIDFYLPDGAPCVWSCSNSARKTKGDDNTKIKSNISNGVEIFPNPNQGQFTLKVNFGEHTAKQINIHLYNLEGKLLKTLEYSEHLSEFDLSEFGKGIYLLSVTSVNSNEVHKLIVN